MSGFEKFLLWAQKNNWVIKKGTSADKLPELYKGRIGEFEKIISSYSCISNESDTIWLVTGDALSNDDENAFSWDAFKKISLSAADTAEEADEVNQWWNNRFPILYSVENGYEFYAVNTEDGSIEYACEPMFEDSERAADNIEQFFRDIADGKIEL